MGLYELRHKHMVSAETHAKGTQGRAGSLIERPNILRGRVAIKHAVTFHNAKGNAALQPCKTFSLAQFNQNAQLVFNMLGNKTLQALGGLVAQGCGQPLIRKQMHAWRQPVIRGAQMSNGLTLPHQARISGK